MTKESKEKHVFFSDELRSFKCGGSCTSTFETMYELNDHLRDHVEGGSYIYRHTIKTGYPIRVYQDASSQYDMSDLQKPNECTDNDTAKQHNKSGPKDTSTHGLQMSIHGASNSNSQVGNDRILPNVGIKDETFENGIDDEHTFSDNSGYESDKSTMNAETAYQPRASKEKIKSEPTNKHWSDDPQSKYDASDAHDEDGTKHSGTTATSLSAVHNDGDLADLKAETPENVKRKQVRKPNKSKRAKTLLKKASAEAPKQNIVERNTRRKSYKLSIEEVADFKDAKEAIKTLDEDENAKRTQTLPADKLSRKPKVTQMFRKVPCEQCGKKISIIQMRRHLRRAHGAPKKAAGRPKIAPVFFHCDECEKEVNIKEKKKHNKMYHPAKRQSQGTEMCEVCGKVFMNSWSLKTHKNVHITNDLACPLCNYVASTKSKLNGHKLRHLKKECTVCGQVVIRKDYRDHVRNVHMGEKRFFCDICSKSFFKGDGLRKHRKTHFEPSFPCRYCGRKFSCGSSKDRHELTHTGEKRWKCKICNHGFIQSTPYWVHMQKQHSLSKQEAMALNDDKKDVIYKVKLD